MINRKNYVLDIMSLPSRGAWIEILLSRLINQAIQSLPSRGAWIEMSLRFLLSPLSRRRSLHGERGLKLCPVLMFAFSHIVAPFTGSVDWNSFTQLTQPYSFQVAPFTGSVDWNRQTNWVSLWHILSLPSRGAWIEITGVSRKLRLYLRRSLHGERGLKFFYL